MMDFSKLSVNKLRTELWTCHILSDQRCLRKACEWAEDQIFALPEDGEEKVLTKLEKELNDVVTANAEFEHARACFDLNEYSRAANIIISYGDDDKSRFLHFFAKYKAAEKKRIDLMNEISINLPRKAAQEFEELRLSIEASMEKREPDGWLLYVYALVLYKARLRDTAIEVLERSVSLTPINWSAWHLLTILVDNKEKLDKLELPNHLFKIFFYYIMRAEFSIQSDEPWTLVSSKDTSNIIDKHFKNSLFIKTLVAKSLGYSQRKYDEAIEIFKEIRTQDPYRIDSMDVYSNLLFVRKMKKELAQLAYEIEKVDPMTPEANCCIANSYSLREQHAKAIVHFTRALRLNPDHLNSWTLIGHEYLEIKMIDKAVMAYRSAITLSRRDSRAWLGLGNTFETVMNSPNVSNRNYDSCLYYYSQVAKYRPGDQLMLEAMGNIFEKMNLHKEAAMCLEQVDPNSAGVSRLSMNGASNHEITNESMVTF